MRVASYRSMRRANSSSRGVYWLLWVAVCDLESSRMRRPWPDLGCCDKGREIESYPITGLGQALKAPGGWGSRISIQSALEGGKVVSPTHRPLLPPRKGSWYSFLLEAESTPRAIVRPEGLSRWKIPVTPSGTEPATYRLVEQFLNQLRHRVTQRDRNLPTN